MVLFELISIFAIFLFLIYLCRFSDNRIKVIGANVIG